MRFVGVDDASLSIVEGDQRLRELTRGCIAEAMEAELSILKDGSVAIFFELGGGMVMRRSCDGGHTWALPVKGIDPQPQCANERKR